MLVSALATKVFTFYLNRNDFSEDGSGVQFAINVMQNNWNLRDFRWTNNPISDIECAVELAETIIKHPSIVTVDLEGCWEGDGVVTECFANFSRTKWLLL